MASPAPRSVADAIRAMDEPALVSLLQARPDLAQPRPATLTELIERATSATSSQLAIERLDSWHRRVAEGLAASHGPTSARALAAWLEADKGAVSAAIDRLREQALAWGSGATVQLTRPAAAAFGPHPGGLAAPGPAPLDQATIAAALDQADPAEHRLLETLVWQGAGKLRGARRPLTLANAETAAERLVARRLLRPIDEDGVVLAREVALVLRQGRLFRDPVQQSPPGFAAASADKVQANAALGSATELVEAVTAVVEALIDSPARVLSSGGIGRREQRQLAAVAPGQPGPLLLGLARTAGLIAPQGLHWLASTGFDTWAHSDGWSQWRALVRAWLRLDQWPSTDSDPTLPTGQRFTPTLRQSFLAELRHAGPGTPVDAAILSSRVAWRHPSWPATLVTEGAERFLAEAAALGVVALGRTSALLDAEADPGFPAPVHQFVVQSDLSAVTAGPLQVDVRRRLDLLTEKDGPTRRFTASSIRRGLDHGLTSERLLDWLAHHSLTPIPQPLVYLVGDVARQHGQIQVMAAATVITIEDAAVLEALLRSPAARQLGLHRVGPQAVAAQADVVEVVDLLRQLGHAPVATSSEGDLMSAPPPARATRVDLPPEPRPVSKDQLTLLARALREPSDGAAGGSDLVELLGNAQASGAWVDLVHVDADGKRRARTARVLGVAAGQVRLVPRASAPITLPVARIVSVTDMSTG